MACFQQVAIVCTPCNDELIVTRLAELGAEVAEFSLIGENLVVYSGGFLGAFREPLVSIGDPQRPVNPASSVSILDDLFARDEQVDLFIVRPGDPYEDRSNVRPRRVSPAEALELVRLLFLINDVYELRPGFPLPPWIYYLVRSKRVFPELQRAWTVAAHAGEEGLPAGLYRQLESLGHRIGFLLRAADRTSIHALRDPGNTAEEESLFHLGYLVMLATGVFDDLAWLIQQRYALGVHAKEVGLRFNAKRPDFFKRLKGKNAALHAYLTDAETQAALKVVYPVRDRLQHQMFLRSLLLSSPRHHGIVFEFPEGFAASVELLDGTTSLASWGVVRTRDEYVDPHRFASRVVAMLAEIVNTVLRLIDFDTLAATLPGEKQEAIRVSHLKFESGLGRFMDWGQEPLHF